MKSAALFPTALTLLTSPVPGEEFPAAKAALEKWRVALGIDRPWDDLAGVPESIKRHRGTFALVYPRTQGSRAKSPAGQNLFRDLERLLAMKDGKEVLAAKPQFSDYRKSFKVDVFAMFQGLISGEKVPPRWKAGFTEAYYSQADGVSIRFGVRTPPKIEGRETYPLLVVLRHGPIFEPSEEHPFIEIKPSGRGVWGYRTMSRYGVMCAIEAMKRRYPVDPDRVYLSGASAGASAAVHLASCHADEFAALVPFVAFGTDMPLANFRNLPITTHHGTNDWISSVCNVRVQHQKLKALNCPAILKEYPRRGHGVPKPHEPILDWMLKHKRPQAPKTITHLCETPLLGRSYWFHIRELQDPHARAFAEASHENGVVKVKLVNVQVFSLDLKRLAAAGKPVKSIEIGKGRLSVRAGAERVDCVLREGRWQASGERARPAKRPYVAGAASNFYQGEPLLVVYGTGGSRGHVGLLRRCARKIATHGGPVFAPMSGSFPVLADTALTPEQAANCNLILVGKPEENRVTRAMLPKLPVEIKNGELHAAGRPPLKLDGQVLSLLHYNPDHPRRLVCLVAPFTDDEGLARFSKAAHRFLPGSNGFDRLSGSDLIVQDLDQEIGRQMQFDKQWKWVSFPDAGKAIPERYRNRANLAAAYMKIMHRKSGVDFAFWWGPADEGMWGYDFNYLKRYNPKSYTRADFSTRHHFAETMIGGVSGAELKDIFKRWISRQEIITVPDVEPDALADGKQYRVNIPMDMYIKLGGRAKALKDPKPGPTVRSEEVMAEIFK